MRWNLQVFVPVRPESGRTDEASAELARVRAELAELGGGATVTDARGVWFDEDGNAHEDAVSIVETDARGDGEALAATVQRIAARVAGALDESAVYARVRPAGTIILATPYPAAKV